MKKLWITAALALLLSGCSQPQSLETVADPVVTPELPEPMAAIFNVPLEAVQETAADETGSVHYTCDGYTLTLQTVPSGDIHTTVRDATGFLPTQLDILQTRQNNADQYSFVWASASETGDQVGRCTILDDGSYHYVLTAMAAYEEAGQLSRGQWREVFASFRLVKPEDVVSSGS